MNDIFLFILLLLFPYLIILYWYKISKGESLASFENRRMRFLTSLKYFLNTILFVVFWIIMFLPVAKFSFDTDSTSTAVVGGIVALIISCVLVKRINKSNLWSRLFYLQEVSSDESRSSNTSEQKNQVESTSIGIADELAKLNRLKQEGVLTEEEFESQKKKLLS